MASDPARIARNESLFRDVNERIAESAKTAPVGEAEFICECGDLTCTHRIEAALEEYDEVRAKPTLFIVKPGHVDAGVERVVEEKDGYDVVEKDVPPAAREARKLDPR
jgi:hypothetical protein